MLTSVLPNKSFANFSRPYDVRKQLTDEQQQAVHLAQSGHSLKIAAFAGTGKTTTLLGIAHALKGKRGLYVAFNKANANDAAGRFPGYVDCRTAHSLAFREMGSLFKSRLGGRLTGSKTANLLGIDSSLSSLSPAALGYLILDTIQRYTQGTDSEIDKTHVPHHPLDRVEKASDRQEIVEMVVRHARKLWALKTNPTSHVPVSHDDYLKLWALSEPKLDYDYILFDEAQDANPVMLSLITRQHAQQIFVGDRFQQIYAWRGAVNAMDKIEADRTTSLRQSFRFGPAIAATANLILGLSYDQGLMGLQSLKSQINPNESPEAIICRSNAGALSVMIQQYNLKRTPRLAKGAAEMAQLLEGAQQLLAGKPAQTAELALFNTWQEVQEHAETEQGKGLKPLIKIVSQYRAVLPSLTRLVWNAHETPVEQADVSITTTHGAKGLEWDSVQIADDFFESKNIEQWSEERNLLYVAATRAVMHLDIALCQPLQNKLSYSKFN